MKITKNKDNYLLENKYGSYHFTHEKFNELGEIEAVKYAEKEIRKKSTAYLDAEIDFKKARAIGFCEYGIEDFCEKLNLDIGKSYKLDHLKGLLTPDVILSYPDECLKLFGKSLLDKFGGVKKFLIENKTRNALNFILTNYVSENTCHELGVVFALSCIDNFEKEYPDDKRPRQAIEAKQKWLRGEITERDLAAAESAAWSAVDLAESARSAAWSSARSAAWSTARSAAWSTAWSAESAAWSAESAWSAALDFQIKETLKRMEA